MRAALMAALSLALPQASHGGGTPYEDQLAGFVLGLSKQVFLYEIVGLKMTPEPSRWPLPMCSVDQIQAGLANKELAEKIFSDCTVVETGITAKPFNFENRGWSWRIDLGDANVCAHYSNYYNEVIAKIKAIKRDPMARNAFTIQIGSVATPSSDGEIIPLQKSKLVIARCENSTLITAMVP